MRLRISAIMPAGRLFGSNPGGMPMGAAPAGPAAPAAAAPGALGALLLAAAPPPGAGAPPGTAPMEAAMRVICSMSVGGRGCGGSRGD